MSKRHTLVFMKKYIEKNELAALFFLHYFKYTRFAFKKQKSDEDKASINAHRALMRLFGEWHREEGRVFASSVIEGIRHHIVSTDSSYVRSFVAVMEEALAFMYDNVLSNEQEQRLLERYA